MRVLFLGPETSPALGLLRLTDEVEQSTEPLPVSPDCDFIVSHGYRHIVPRAVCEAFDGRAVNLHISYLPWNRGADPNLWSHVDGTPKGVTIHYIAPGLDTGDIIAQRKVRFDIGDTLATSYAKLQDELVSLFADHWPAIKNGTCGRTPQSGGGSYHRSADKARVAHFLTEGWDTRVSVIQALAEGATPRRGMMFD
jgi:methionyl-tRNA formyltransferase